MADLKRRDTLRLLALTPALVAIGAGARATSQEQASSLVAYFSRTGNTRVIAHQIQRALGADIFEIVPAVAYPEDYLQTVEQARLETADGFRPELRDCVDIGRYDTIYLGFPIWGMTAPPIIRAFLAAHELSGMTIVPFITHGGYGPGTSLDVIAYHAPGAQMAEAFVMEADQERRTLERVTGWLGDRST